MRKLTPKQDAFCQHYATGLNVKEAVLKAGYSKKRPDEMGYQLLQIPTVHEAIQEYRKAAAKKLEISCLRVVQEFVAVGFSSMAHFLEADEHGNAQVKALKDIPAHAWKAVSTFEQVEEGTGSRRKKRTKIGLWGKVPGLDSLSKSLGFDKASLEQELKALEPPKAVKKFDPTVLTDAEFELYAKIRAKQLGKAGL